MNIADAIAFLDRQVPNPTAGLPEELFLFASRITPLVNVDLLVRDARGRTLLAWRDDCFNGQGWHIPGGIVRFKETLATRLQKVAEQELGTRVEFEPTPVAMHEIMHPTRATRGHFLSLLYRCRVPAGYAPDNAKHPEGTAGYLRWHDGCPENLIAVHEVYRAILAGTAGTVY